MTPRYSHFSKLSPVSQTFYFLSRIVSDVCPQLSTFLLEQQLPGESSRCDVTPLSGRWIVRWPVPPSQRSDCSFRPLAFPLPAVQCGRRSPSPQVALTSGIFGIQYIPIVHSILQKFPVKYAHLSFAYRQWWWKNVHITFNPTLDIHTMWWLR